MLKNERQEQTLVFVPGSWSPPEVFDPLIAELENFHDCEAIAVETGANERGTSFRSDALEVLHQIRNRENVSLIGWSRGFNIALHAAVMAEDHAKITGRLALRHIIGLAGSADRSIMPRQPGEDESLRGRNTPEFRALVKDIGGGQTVIYDPNDPGMNDDEKAERRQAVVDLMVPDCDQLTQIEFTANLRSHRRIKHEPVLPVLPEIPITYIEFTEDKVIRSAFVSELLVPYFTARHIKSPGSHAGGFLAHNARLADTIMNIVDDKTALPNTTGGFDVRPIRRAASARN